MRNQQMRRVGFLALWVVLATVSCARYKLVSIKTVPSEADIYLNGAKAGISPLTTKLSFSDIPSYEVRAQKEGYEDGSTTIQYEPKNISDYTIELRKKEVVTIDLVSFVPEKTEAGIKLVRVRKPTIAYLETIERSPNVQSVTRVTSNEDPAFQIGSPVLSKDGTVLVYRILTEEQGGDWYSNLWKMKVGSPARTCVTLGKWRDLFPALSADGKMLVFSSNRNSANPTLWRISMEGRGGITRLTNTQAEDISPSVAPDGKNIAYCSLIPRADDCQVWSIREDGALATQLREGESPEIAPDGKKILYTRRDRISGCRHIWLMDVDGGSETQLTRGTTYNTIDARWSPDGKQIVYASDEGMDSSKKQNYDIWIMDADGGRPTQLTTNGSRDDSPFFCVGADGPMIYFRSNRGGAWNIWRFSPVGTTAGAAPPAPEPEKKPPEPAPK